MTLVLVGLDIYYKTFQVVQMTLNTLNLSLNESIKTSKIL